LKLLPPDGIAYFEAKITKLDLGYG